ncbi:MAG: S41 family peptidase [Anaerolineae bacterium]|nr:S41 family peptidase [Anaerolineae bacterium]
MSHRMRNIATVFMVVMMAVAAFAAGFLANDFARGVRAEDRTTVSAEEFGVFWEAWDRVQETFIDELPASNEVVYGAIRGSLRELNDPYTVFIEPVAREQERVRLQGTFGGIGANVFRDENGNVVLEPIAGNPAEAAGVLSGDILIAVDGEPVGADATVEQIVQMVRGEVGTPVVITVLHPDSAESVDLEVIRAVILLPSVDYRLLEADPTVGYVQLARFSAESGTEVGAALTDLMAQGADKFILDLRYNGGGLLDASVAVVDHFLADQPVYYQLTRASGEQTVRTNAETLVPDAPLVVLVNEGTASSSEIVAGALQDLGRATLIGSQTFGKGSVQLVYDLSDGSSVHVTSARWFTPDRQQIDQNGLTPDIEVDLTQEAIDAGRDDTLARAVAFLQNGQ